jgi:hypothetical protein
MNNCPCYNDGKGCDKRTAIPNCHATCNEYNEWVVERAQKKIDNSSESTYLGYYYNILLKHKKKGNHK